MTLRIATIVLDGMPWLAAHLPVFNKLPFDWRWDISEGTAAPVADTAWCRPVDPRLSRDGTTEYLDSISRHPKIKVHRQPQWPGKCAQINSCLEGVKPGDVVLEVDSDELWTARQIEVIVRLLTTGNNWNSALFRCRYFVGPDLLITSREGYGNHVEYEWRRAWLAQEGFRFLRHEPPETNRIDVPVRQDTTESLGLVFDHYAYALKRQVVFKQEYYGYRHAVEQWEKLQKNIQWPARLGDFLDWVKDETTVERLK